MRIIGVARRHGETPVVIFHEGQHKGVGGVHIVYAPEPEFLDQPVLKGLVGPFHAALRLWAIGVGRGDIHGLEGTGELSKCAIALRMIDTKDAVSVRVQGHRTPMPGQIRRQSLHVGAGGSRPTQNAVPTDGWWHRR